MIKKEQKFNLDQTKKYVETNTNLIDEQDKSIKSLRGELAKIMKIDEEFQNKTIKKFAKIKMKVL